MIQKTHNAITDGCSGKFGNQVVVRIRYGKKIICAPPPKRGKKGTPGQLAAQEKFAQANKYARLVKLFAGTNSAL